jgi:hypothetical protein
MSCSALRTRGQALFDCATLALTVLACAALLFAAALVPAPPVVLPLIALVCIGSPIAASCDLRPSLAILRTSGGLTRRRSNARLLAEMRDYLAQLPETPHPRDG